MIELTQDEPPSTQRPGEPPWIAARRPPLDTVGSRLSAAMNWAKNAELWQRARLGTHGIARESIDLDIAVCEGTAAGHAFRAAELAHELQRRSTNRRHELLRAIASDVDELPLLTFG